MKKCTESARRVISDNASPLIVISTLRWVRGTTWRATGGSEMANGYVKNWTKWSSKVTPPWDFWPRKSKYRGGNISRRRCQKSRTQKFEFVTEVTVPFFRPPVAPHDRNKPTYVDGYLHFFSYHKKNGNSGCPPKFSRGSGPTLAKN